MSEQSPRMIWNYPSREDDPWYDGFQDFVNASDGSAFANREDRSIIWSGGGTLSWTLSSGTFTWTDTINIYSPMSAKLIQVEADSITSWADGEIVYVDVTRLVLVNTTKVLQKASSLPSTDDAMALAVRIGDVLYFRTGMSLGDGNSSIGIAPVPGGGSGSALEVEDEGVPVDTDVVKMDFIGSGVAATQTAPGEVEINIPGGGSPLEIEDEGSSVDTDVVNIDFVGAGVTATQTAAGHVEVNIPGGGGGGNDSLPDIDQWVIVDKTTGSYTADGTIQFPENSIANAIVDAAAFTPTATKRVGIKLMPGHYTEAGLDLPSYVYVIGESKQACVIQNVAGTTVLAQTNSYCGFYNVSFGSTGTDISSYVLELGDAAGSGIVDAIFEHVDFDFDKSRGVKVQGLSSASSVFFYNCQMDANLDTGSVPYFGACLHMFDDNDHAVHLVRSRVLDGSGSIWVNQGSLYLTDTEVNGQIRLTSSSSGVTTANVSLKRSSVINFDIQNEGVFSGALYLNTTGEVFGEYSILSGFGYSTFFPFPDQWDRYCVFVVDRDNPPSVFEFSHCKFTYPSFLPSGDYIVPTRSIATGPGAFTADIVTGIFRNCYFKVGVSDNIGPSDSTIYPVGVGQMYSTSQYAMEAVNNAATDYLTVKLMSDDIPNIGNSWPADKWVIFDLNGHIADATTFGRNLIDLYYSEHPKAIIQNGRFEGKWTFFKKSFAFGNTNNWDVTFRNIVVDDTWGGLFDVTAGGSGAKLLLDNMHLPKGFLECCINIEDSNPTVHVKDSYLKGNTGFEAVRFDNVANNKFAAIRSTLQHGDGGSNSPIASAATTTQGSGDVVLSFCRMNADPDGDANINVIGESAYNIINSSIVDL